MEIWTNGAMKPEEAISLASRIIIEHFEILTKLDEIYKSNTKVQILLDVNPVRM